MKFRFDKNVSALLEGSIDIHIHSAPDVYPRLLNDVELALSAKENGMRAILVKNHYFETAGRARLATDVADFPVFGGIVLNLTNGGLNKHAVKMALKMGAKEVWMPTVHADYFVKNKSHVANLATEIGADVQGLVLVKEDGTLKDELFEIFDIIKEADAILATGHVTKEEAKLAVREAAKRGVKKIIVTHPAATFVHYSVDDMKEILDLGATFLEHTWNDVTRQVSHPLQISVLFDIIKAVGAAHSIMSTDAGQWLNPPAAQQMGIYIKEALMSGISAKDVRMMVADNPAKILGI
jgi:deoxyribose-phosphate aldolase